MGRIIEIESQKANQKIKKSQGSMGSAFFSSPKWYDFFKREFYLLLVYNYFLCPKILSTARSMSLLFFHIVTGSAVARSIDVSVNASIAGSTWLFASAVIYSSSTDLFWSLSFFTTSDTTAITTIPARAFLLHVSWIFDLFGSVVFGIFLLLIYNS